MNQENRDKVNNYLNKLSKEKLQPLYFVDCDTEKEVNIRISKEKSIEYIVYRILCCTIDYLSFNSKTKKLETYAGRYRSVLDIWRHIIYIIPDITIFEVISGIYNSKVPFDGQYCYDIHRRTFTINNFGFTKEYLSKFHDHEDEFGLNFSDWDEI